MDVRIMKRDYSIAEMVWQNYDYDTTRLYIQRILDRENEIPEATIPILFLIILGSVSLTYMNSK